MAINTRTQYNLAPPPAKPKSNRPYTLIGAVLAVLGFGLVMLFSFVTGGKTASGTPAVSQSSIVVAARDIAPRTPLTADDVKVVKYATTDLPPSAVLKLDDAKGKVATVAILKGQPLTANLLAKSADEVVGAQPSYLPIPSGWVALTIPTGEEQGVAGYIGVGDYISIVATVPGRAGQNVRTLYTNVHVLRIGPAASDATTGATKSSTQSAGLSSSITVVVTQCQAEYLNWFLANASVKYTLESYKDYKPQDTAVDATCPNVSAANGVTHDNIAQRWPGIFN